MSVKKLSLSLSIKFTGCYSKNIHRCKVIKEHVDNNVDLFYIPEYSNREHVTDILI